MSDDKHWKYIAENNFVKQKTLNVVQFESRYQTLIGSQFPGRGFKLEQITNKN